MVEYNETFPMVELGAEFLFLAEIAKTAEIVLKLTTDIHRYSLIGSLLVDCDTLRMVECNEIFPMVEQRKFSRKM